MTKFKETYSLENSFTNLTKSLVSVGDIISGIADRIIYCNFKKWQQHTKTSWWNDGSPFLDIQGFTTIAEKHKNDIMKIVNRYGWMLKKIIAAKKAKINNIWVMHAWLFSGKKDNKSKNPTALNAFYCAIELLELVPEICKQLDISFNFRIGLTLEKLPMVKPERIIIMNSGLSGILSILLHDWKLE